MKQESFRIVHQETGQVRFVGKALFGDVQTLKQMGFIQQDLGSKEDPKYIADTTNLKEKGTIDVTTDGKTQTVEVFDPLDPPQLGDSIPDPLSVEQQEPVKAKRGPKSKKA